MSAQPTFRNLPSIISPWVDFLCVGGFSIVVMLVLLAVFTFYGTVNTGHVNLGNLLVMQALINWPHFMASYRLLYVPRENIRRYPFSAIYVPLALIVLMIACLEFTDNGIGINQDVSYFLWLGAAFYLAWHYTGQAWGMVATFSRLAGINLNDTERLFLRFGLRILLAWHVVWGAQDLPSHWLGPIHPFVPLLLQLVSAAAIAAFVVGVFIFWQIKQRTGKTPTPQMIAPWLAIYLWYLVLSVEPDVYMVIQLSHALQYLIFPLRVELNRSGIDTPSFRDIGVWVWSGRYYLVLIAIGALIFYAPTLLPLEPGKPFSVAIVLGSAVSIHHYFVDGAIWKISNKTVRQRLFAHLTPARDQSSAA